MWGEEEWGLVGLVIRAGRGAKRFLRRQLAAASGRGVGGRMGAHVGHLPCPARCTRDKGRQKHSASGKGRADQGKNTEPAARTQR